MNILKQAVSVISGRKRCVIWEVTTACTCKCKMCGVWTHKPVFTKNWRELIDFMKDNKTLILSITGGEPTMHPDIIEIIKYASSKGFVTHMPTNGTLMTKELAQELKNAGLDLISISIDHYKKEIQDELRRLKDCHEKAENAIKLCKQAGLAVTTSTVLTIHNYKEIKKVINYINKDLSTGFTLCTPHTSPNNAFLASDSKEVELKNNDLIKTANEIIQLKKQGFKIENSSEFIQEYIDSLNNKAKYACQGNDFVYYLDVNEEFHPCFNKPATFNIKTGWKTIKNKCKECNIQCFKEPSVINQLSIAGKAKYLLDLVKSTINSKK